MIPSARIMQVLTDEQDIAAKAQALVDAANEAGGNDNITVVLIQNDNWPKQKEAPVAIERKKAETEVPVIANEVLPETGFAQAKKKNRRMVAFIVVILIGLGAVSLTVAFQNNKKKIIPATIAPGVEKKPNERLTQLVAHLSDSSNSYLLPPGNAAISLNAPLIIAKDSFYLSGNGAVFVADSLYKGPAVIIDAAAKNIVIDSVAFQNFDVGIVIEKNNITFRHVRFINCLIPVQYKVAFTDSVISGQFKDSLFFIPKKSR
jgi:hypothetical protein